MGIVPPGSIPPQLLARARKENSIGFGQELLSRIRDHEIVHELFNGRLRTRGRFELFQLARGHGSIDDVAVVGPDGPVEPAEAVRRIDCPVAPELFRLAG